MFLKGKTTIREAYGRCYRSKRGATYAFLRFCGEVAKEGFL